MISKSSSVTCVHEVSIASKVTGYTSSILRLVRVWREERPDLLVNKHDAISYVMKVPVFISTLKGADQCSVWRWRRGEVACFGDDLHEAL